MFFFTKKTEQNTDDMQNWYSDRYASVSIQRNFLLLFSIIISISVLVCLMVIRSIQEGKSSVPYFIEYDKDSGYTYVVDAQSKQEYTAQQAVKESMIIQYINKREAPRLSTLEDDMNYVRVMSSSKLYESYTRSVISTVSALRKEGLNSKYSIEIKSLTYLSANRVKISFSRILRNDNEQEVSSNDYILTTTFGFSDAETTIDDMRINPLGFQVVSYNLTPVKTYQSALGIKSDDNDNE